MRHYQQLGGSLDEARADGAATSSNVNGLLSALLGLVGQGSAPSLPTMAAPQWQPPAGLDATGHKRDSALSTYVMGDDAP